MEELLANLYANSSVPMWSAVLLGLLTAISPCPLATNITAIGYIGKDIENRKKVFLNGLIYTIGRLVAYTGLAAIILWSGTQISIVSFLQTKGEKIIGPLLIIIGIFMLGIININFPAFSKAKDRFQNKAKRSFIDVFLMGVVFALAFCPYSGVLYFGMLIPLMLSSQEGLLIPLIFSVATGLPVIAFAWMVAFAVSSLGVVYNRIKKFEFWFRRIVAVLFIGTGLYYIIILF